LLFSLDWSSSRVSSWHFELKSISSWVAHIFNLIQVELLIFSTWCNSTHQELELDIKSVKNRNIKQHVCLFFALSFHITHCIVYILHYRSAMKLICTWCWLRIYCLATVESKDYQKFEWHRSAAWWWSAMRWSRAEFSRSRRLR